MGKVGQNEVCPCGSGKKYKRCHGAGPASQPRAASAATTTTAPRRTRELFKYRAVNEYTLAFLSTGAVYFSSPAELNDPFDMGYDVRRDMRAEQQQFERERTAEGTDSALLAIIMSKGFEREHRAGGVKTRIYCVSEVVDNILMWSHYADSHRGICVVLEAEQVSETCFLPFAASSINLSGMAVVRVSAGRLKRSADGRIKRLEPSQQALRNLPAHRILYRDQVPGLFEFDPLPGGPMRGVTFELVKQTAWAYERERRVVVSESLLTENPAHLNSDAIVGVVFGMKISKADILRVRAAVDRCARTRPIAYSRMIADPGAFGLERVPVPDIDEFIRSL